MASDSIPPDCEATQPELFDWIGPRDEERRWAQWLADNQVLWRAFVRFTFDAISAGKEHYSADAVLHRVRWESAIVERGGDGWKCNNNWTAYLAREFHRAYPEHAGFFRTRTSRASAAIQGCKGVG